MNIALENITLSARTLPQEATFRERVEAAEAAGFSAIGIGLAEYAAFKGRAPDYRVNNYLSDHGIQVREIEFFLGWMDLRKRDKDYATKEEQLFHMTRALDAGRINITMFGDYSPAEATDAFGELCDRAQRFEIPHMQLEWMPYTPMANTLDKARRIVEDVNRPNGSLIIDAWHYARTPLAHIDLERLLIERPDLITGIQLSDALPEPFGYNPHSSLINLRNESRKFRCIPGEGAVDLPAFMARFQGAGIEPALSVEIMSCDLQAKTPEAAARLVADGLRRTFGGA